jgi:hypothetical protein
MNQVVADIASSRAFQKCWCGGKVNSMGSCVESPLHDPHSTGRPERISRLYIAGPMSGYPEANYPAFDEAQYRLEAAGYIAVNPTKVHVARCHYVDLIREDLRVMLDCHGIAVLENWWESTGARNEVSVGGILKMPVRTVPEWLERAHQELN